MTEWIEITTEEGPDENATERVPKEWYEYNQRAKGVLETLRDRFRDEPGVTGTGLHRSEQTIAGKHVLQPVVYAEETVTQDVPDEIDGIPIRIEPPRGDAVAL
ncbi:hypothetical protein OB955_18675 [Halobacteria archaeon AArc-m2/3/4]|uniref:Uncharacterized protein n=1 Tax=Natronoglomus mannanivorans TaxID=2979990 RepID=A0AAP2Z1M0_9EURY|nr:hypothetical protein [Halobacteria archaeon AArc-xg1-1]MCU4974748.1 hypothetical protein [Halobacteria archaeon AArc-m2/3/4]